MAATVYQSRKTTEEKMNSLFRAMIRDGKTLLPTELKLCELLGASRRVIRELLQEKRNGANSSANRAGALCPCPSHQPDVLRSFPADATFRKTRPGQNCGSCFSRTLPHTI